MPNAVNKPGPVIMTASYGVVGKGIYPITHLQYPCLECTVCKQKLSTGEFLLEWDGTIAVPYHLDCYKLDPLTVILKQLERQIESDKQN